MERREMYAQKIAVTVYNGVQRLIGFVALPPGKRLSDLLNGTVGGQAESGDTFLELTDVTIWQEGGTKEKQENVYINKANIELLATTDNDLSRGSGAKSGLKSYPFVQKSPVRARIRVSSYKLTGNLHKTQGHTVQQLLEEKLTFLPLTDAKILSLIHI